jgi:GDP-L-fucose synthase
MDAPFILDNFFIKQVSVMEKDSKIYVAGHRGMVGSAIVRELRRQGYMNIITRTHRELDLCRQDEVERFFVEEKPEYVFLAAAKVGGIVANSEALADFMYDNMMLEMNVINSAWRNGCRKLEFLGSSCIYPRMAPQPMKEECLLTSELEKTNEAYALAKISGLKYCEFLNRQYGTDFISVMPTNLYGINDNYHPTHSHVVPALIRRFHEAKELGLAQVTCWGDGSPLREFLYVDDLADLCVFLMNNYSGNETVNAGSGKELSIKELTGLVAKVVGYEGEILWDTTKPNGTPRKLLDVSKSAALGWRYKTELEEGLRLAYADFLSNPMRAER